MPFTKSARDRRLARNALLAELYADGWTADRIARRGDMGGLSAAGVNKVLVRAGVARRAPGPQPRGPGPEAAAPDDQTQIQCPRCRSRHVFRRHQPACTCGWVFEVFHGPRRPRFATTSRYFELDHHGMPVETIGPGVW